MEILKHGKVDCSDISKWKMKVYCRKYDKFDKKGCGAVMMAGFGDLVMMHFFGTHFIHHYSAVMCLDCGKYNRTIVPYPIWEKFSTKKNLDNSIFDGFDDRI